MWAPYVAAFQHDSKVLKETSPERESKEEGIALSVALVSEVTQPHLCHIPLVQAFKKKIDKEFPLWHSRNKSD